MELKIVRWLVEKLVPYARNARTHSPEQIAQVAGSIAEFGFVNPILVGPDQCHNRRSRQVARREEARADGSASYCARSSVQNAASGTGHRGQPVGANHSADY